MWAAGWLSRAVRLKPHTARGGGAWRRDGTQAGVAVAAWWWRQESEK